MGVSGMGKREGIPVRSNHCAIRRTSVPMKAFATSYKSPLRRLTLPPSPPHPRQVVLVLCTHRPSFMSSADNLPDLLELFTSSLTTCIVSARVMRLQCLSKLVSSLEPGDPAHGRFLPAATSEVVLCTKDSNGRARELAYDVLVLLAVGRGKPADTVRDVVGSLEAGTPHARSAAVLALSRLQLEFGHFRSERWDAVVADMLPDLTRKMLVLLKEPSREVAKAVLGWLRVALGGADRDLLRPMVGDIVTAVMSGTTPGHKVSGHPASIRCCGLLGKGRKRWPGDCSYRPFRILLLVR